jgi:hypothetical protein
MLRPLIVLAGAAMLTLAVSPPVAPADPGPALCEYTLSPPHVVQLSGTDVVTATLSPAGCNQSTPYQTVACLEKVGTDGPGRCEENSGNLPAQVYYAPYEPGATYVSTGRGCASTGNPPLPVCTPTGPFTAEL